MNLFSITIDQLNWLRSLWRKVWRLTPWQVTGGIMGFMASQLFLLMAFLLPLKVVLLVAQDGVPWYLASVVSIETKDRFVILLASGAIASYGIYHLCNWVVNRTVANGADRVLEKAQKLYLFNKQEELAREGYLRLVRAVASCVLVVLGFAVGILMNATVFGTLVVVIVAEVLVLAYLLRLDTDLSRWLVNAFEKRLSVAVGVLSSLNFLVAFALLLVQFLDTEQLSVIIAILSIILCRQVLLRCAACVQDLSYLGKHRQRLTTIFYTSIQYLPVPDTQQNAFLARLRPQNRNRWLRNTLQEIMGRELSAVTSRWMDSGTSGVAWLDVTETSHGETRHGERYFVKYYGHRHTVRAAHESHLFSSHPDDVPGAPIFLGEGFVEGSRLMVFKGFDMCALKPRKWRALSPRVLVMCWSFNPDPEFVSAYRRTHSIILDRLDLKRFRQMEVAVETTEDELVLQDFCSLWPEIYKLVEGMPLVLRNPALARIQGWVSDECGRPCCLNWNSWSIEPIGCEPALLRMKTRTLEHHLPRWTEGTPFEQDISVAGIYLVAKLFALEESLTKKNLRCGLEIVSELVEDWRSPQNDVSALMAAQH